MPASAVAQAQRAPRHPRYLIPRGTPRRGELVAALATGAVLAHLVLAQLTLVLVVAFYAISKLSRWRPQWLAVPGGAGLVWALAIGPARAMAGLTAGPRQVVAYLAGAGGQPGRLLHPAGAFAGIGHWLPGQLPLAAALAAAEAAGLWWLDWLRADEGSSRLTRPGLIVAARRRYTAASIRSGAIVTRDGGCVGLDTATGRMATISWREAEGGVLCAGPAGPALVQTGFMLACAAIRRRKPVIVIDLSGSSWLASSVASAGTAAGAPLQSFSAAGPGYYEPLRGSNPAHAASLVMSMIDWSDAGDQRRRACAAYLTDVLAVLAAAPGDTRTSVLDEVIRLLSPAALLARAERVPRHHPRREALADRVGLCVSQAEADPGALAPAAAQLSGLRGSALGHWLAPLPRAGCPRVSLGQAVRDRAVVEFSLGSPVPDRSAAMMAGLAVCDLLAVFAELGAMSVPGDGLAWIHGCEAVDYKALAELAAAGSAAGMAVLLSTESATAARLAGDVNVVLARGPADSELASWLAGQAGSNEVSAESLRTLRADEFALLVQGPRQRVRQRCLAVRADEGWHPG